MAAITSQELVTKPMYDSARAGLQECLNCREKLVGYDDLGWPRPDVAAYIDEWQPKLDALVQYYHMRQALKNGTSNA